MKAYPRYLLVLILFVAVFTSCRKSATKQAKYVPKEASFVAAVNAKSLAKKLYDGSFTLDSFYAAVKDTAQQAKMKKGVQHIEELKDAGIDWDSDVLAFVSQKGSMLQGQQTSFGVVGLLSDAAKLEAFLKKQDASVVIQKGDDYSYAVFGDEGVIGWNKEVAVMLANMSQPMPQIDTAYMMGDTSAIPDTMDVDLSPASKDPKAAINELASLMKLKKDASVGSIDVFNDLLKEKADMKVFTNSESTINAVPMIAMSKAGDLLKESYTTATLNFGDGEITGKMTGHYNDELASMLEKNSKGNADLNMVDAFPSKPNVFAVFSFNPQILVDILKFIGFDRTVDDMIANNMKMTTSEILKAFNGDFAIVVSNISEKEEMVEGEKRDKTSADFIFNAKVGDKAAYEKLMAKLAENKMVVRNANGYTLMPPSMPAQDQFASEMNSSNILIASDSAVLQQYKAGAKKDNINSDIRNEVKDKPVSVYVDLAAIFNGFRNDTSAALASAKSTFRDIIMTSDHIKNKKITGDFRMRFVNEKENSLSSLMRWISKVAAEPHRFRMDHDQPWTTTIDTADVTASPVH